MLYKKSIILSSLDNSLKKGVLNLEKKNATYTGNVKLYNFVEEPMGILSLGILINGKVNKIGLSRVGYMSYNFGSILDNIPDNCTCALVSSINGESEPVLLGSIVEDSHSLEERLISSLSILKEKSLEKVQKELEKNQISFDDEEEIEQEIDNCLKCENMCKNCVYKNKFYTQEHKNPVKNSVEDDIDLKNEITKGKLRIPETLNGSFFEEIGPQLEELFKEYPIEETLGEIIPNSKWVKLDFEKNGKFYVLGIIKVDDKAKFICYGIPSKWSEQPPSDFNENAQWLPISLDDKYGEGYWITYQDAEDGELIKVDVI